MKHTQHHSITLLPPPHTQPTSPILPRPHTHTQPPSPLLPPTSHTHTHTAYQRITHGLLENHTPSHGLPENHTQRHTHTHTHTHAHRHTHTHIHSLTHSLTHILTHSHTQFKSKKLYCMNVFLTLLP